MGFSAQVALGGEFISVKSSGVRGSRGGGHRGPVHGFSKASRKRCFDFFNQVDRQGPAPTLFITLTYPGEYSSDWHDWKRDFAAFVRRFKRRYDVPFFWRLEFQRRGAPHFHLLVFGLDQVDISWLSQSWFEIVGSGDERHLRAGTQVQKVRSWRMACCYLSKYLAKSELVQQATGRIWGVVNRSLLVIRLAVVGLEPYQFYQVRRWLRRWRERSGRCRLWYGRGRADGLTAYLSSSVGVALLFAVGV